MGKKTKTTKNASLNQLYSEDSIAKIFPFSLPCDPKPGQLVMSNFIIKWFPWKAHNCIQNERKNAINM